MITLIRPLLFAFLTSAPVKKLVVDLLEALAKETENEVDDQIVEMVKKALA